MMEKPVGMTAVWMGNVERALIAFRQNNETQKGNLNSLRQVLIGKYWKDGWRLLAKFKAWRTGVHPTADEKVLSYSGGDSLWPLTAMFASEQQSLLTVSKDFFKDDDLNREFWSWYIGVDRAEYKAILSLWENTQDCNDVLLTEIGCAFVVKWSAKYAA